MLDKLEEVLTKLPNWLSSPLGWDSLIINRRKPETYRVFRQWGDYRVCLHRFSPCDDSEAFVHPHPWAAAFKIIHGKYKMRFGQVRDVDTIMPRHFEELILTKGCEYEIVDQLTFHSIIPLQTTYTVMVNGPPWSITHPSVRTTKGKDLDRMSDTQLEYFCEIFRNLLEC